MKRIYLLIALISTLISIESFAQCDPVSAFTCNVQSVSSIEINWQPPALNPDFGYHVQYKSESDPSYSKTATKFSAPWINEVRYRASAGAPEGYEIIGPSGMNLECYEIWPFQGSDITLPGQGTIQKLTGTFSAGSTSNYFGAIWKPLVFQDIGGALALVYNADDCDCAGATELIQYLQFGENSGTKPLVFNTAPSIISTALPLPAAGESLALEGTGDTPDDYAWQFTPSVTDGTINTNQEVASILTQNNETIDFERLNGCTGYNFRIRSISACTNPNGNPSLFGPWDTIPTVCFTQNTIGTGVLLDPNGVACSNILICTGDDPGFNCTAQFTDNNNNPDPCINTLYLITKNDSIVGYYSTPADLNMDIPDLDEGIYEINVIGHNQPISGNAIGNDIADVVSTGCINFLFSNVSLNVYDTPIIDSIQINNPTVCNGANGSITVVVEPSIGTFQYRLIPISTSWQSSNQFTGLGALNGYVIEVRTLEAPFCISSDTFDLVDPDSPILGITSNGPACKGDVASIDLTVSGVAGPFVYNWSNGETTEDITALAGNYSVTVSDPVSMCPSITTITITEPATILNTLIYNVSSVLCFGQSNGMATVSGDGGVPPYTYNWSNGQTNQTATGLSPGMYTFTVTDGNGCVKSNSININGTTLMSFDFVTADTIKCYGDCTATLSASAMGGTLPHTYQWSNNQFGQTITNACAGVYHVSVTDNNGCMIIDSIQVEQRPEFIDSIFFKIPTCHGDSNGTASIHLFGGTPPYQYIWLQFIGNTTPSISNLPAGQYFYNAADSLFCTLGGNFTINDPSPVVANISGNSPVCETDSTLLVASAFGGNCNSFDFNWGNGVQSPDVMVSPLADNTVYAVTATNCDGCATDTTITINIEEYPRNTVSNDTVIISIIDLEVFEIELDDYFDQDAEYTWTAVYEAELIDTVGKPLSGMTSSLLSDSFKYQADSLDVVRIVSYTVQSYSIDNDCKGELLTVVIDLEAIGDKTEAFTEIITPNGDSRNDEFFIYYVDEDKQDAVVKIYNRSGAQVYEGIVGEKDYWNGRYYNNGEFLPDGSYWYIVVDNNEIIKRGAITMIGSGK